MDLRGSPLRHPMNLRKPEDAAVEWFLALDACPADAAMPDLTPLPPGAVAKNARNKDLPPKRVTPKRQSEYILRAWLEVSAARNQFPGAPARGDTACGSRTPYSMAQLHSKAPGCPGAASEIGLRKSRVRCRTASGAAAAATSAVRCVCSTDRAR